MKSLRIAVLGAGPTGLALALRLLQRSDLRAEVHVFERDGDVGGLAGSFERHGIWFDYGSHRLHPAVNPSLLSDLRHLLGADLLHRPRRGRIRLHGRYVNYPLGPIDLALHLPPSFVGGVARDALTSPFRRRNVLAETYADVLLRGLGPTIAESFYFPFARKLWGVEPAEIAAAQAQRRVSADSLSRMLQRVLAAVPAFRGPISGQTYYYPREGFGQISRALAQAVEGLGGKIHLECEVAAVCVENGRAAGLRTTERRGQGDETISVDLIFSTIPVTSLVRCLHPSIPAGLMSDALGLRSRGVLFCYLVLSVDRLTPFDAQYFPEPELIFSRVSEPKNYSGAEAPRRLTGLCVEIPCWPEDAIWLAPADRVAAHVVEHLERAGLPIRVPIEEVFLRRQSYAYPLYDLAFGARLQRLERHLLEVSGLITLGRQGLFAHDNVHHAMEMACTASTCLGPDGSFGMTRWRAHREQFRQHVVVD